MNNHLSIINVFFSFVIESFSSFFSLDYRNFVSYFADFPLQSFSDLLLLKFVFFQFA